jgi:glycosyltransferase involved in cell wall biosynthesis
VNRERSTRTCLVVSSLITAEVFLLDQLAALSSAYDVTLVANTDQHDFLARHGIHARLVPVAIERKIHPARDLAALRSLVRLFRRERFDLVHSVTPKAGLLSAMAGALTSVPVRIHTFTGQVWGGRQGLAQQALKNADRVIAALATDVLVDSQSQREFLIREGVVAEGKSRVLARGSISGVDTDRYRPDPAARREVRAEEGIPEGALVFLYMARLTRDKGALVMAEAFARFADRNPEAHLIVVGPDEEGLRPAIGAACIACSERIHLVDYSRVPERFMAAADVLCLPSFREGFGSVLIDAASAGIPSIASRITGSVDAIEEGVTGLLHEAGNVPEMVSRMEQLALDPSLRREMGEKGRLRAQREFSEEIVTRALLDFYASRLGGAGDWAAGGGR